MNENGLKIKAAGSIVLYVLSGVMLFGDWFSISKETISLTEINEIASYISPEASTYVTVALILACVAILAAVIGVFCKRWVYGAGAPAITGAMLIAALVIAARINDEIRYKLVELTAAPYLAFFFAAAALLVAPKLLIKQDQDGDKRINRIGGVLIAESGDYAGAEFELSDGETLVLGRDPAMCSIVLEDHNISRQHCSIRYSSADGKYYVTDLSSNGTFLEDGVRLQPQTEFAMERGERIYLSNQKDIFVLG